MCEAFSSIHSLINPGQDCASVIFKILYILNVDNAALLCCILWNIWKQRNNKIWNEVVDAQSFVLERAKTMLYDLKAVRLIR